MLSRQHRFHGHTSLAYVYRQGATVRSQHLGLRFICNGRRSEYRVAVIVSRKVHKSAVRRNQVRRRIYEIIRTGSAIAEPYDLVFTVFTEQVADLSPEELKHQVTDLLQKANVYDKTSPEPPAHGILGVKEENRREP